MNRFHSAAPTGTSTQWERLPESGNKFPNIEAIIRYILVCLVINYKKDKTTNVVSPSIKYCMFVLKLKLNNDPHFFNRMRVVLKTQSPTDESIYKHLNWIVRGILQRNGMNHRFGVIVHENFSEDCKLFHTNTEDFQIFFDSVCNDMFPSLEIQKLESDAFFARQRNEVLFKSARIPCTNQSLAAIVARTAVTFTAELQPVVPTLVPVPQPSATPPGDEPVLIVRVLPDPPPRNDATDLILADVKSVVADCVDNAVAKAAESFDAGNRSTVMAITGAPIDAQVLAAEVTCDANGQAMEATVYAFAALEVVEAVKAAADAGESVQRDVPSSNEFKPGESDHQFHANGAGGPLSVIHEEDDADQSGTSSPLPDGKRRAPFTTFAQSLPQGVEDGALGAQSLSLADSLESADAPKSSWSDPRSNFSSGPSGTSLTHESQELLAASMPSSPQSTFNPAATTSADGSNSVQSSGVELGFVLKSPNLLALLDEPPPLPTQSSSSRWHDIGVGGARVHVGVRRNPHANSPSFQPQGCEDPPVQVFAASAHSSDDSGGADHPKTPSSSKFRSSCIPGRKTGSASQRQNPQSSGWLRRIFQSGKSNRVNPSQGETGDTRPPVAHSSGKIPSESAATTPPLPSSISPLGGDIGGSSQAHSQGDPPKIVPSSAPSLSPELGSAATPAAPPLTNKSSTSWGTDIGGTKRSGEMQDIAMVLLLGAHLLHLGVPLAQVPLFSRIPPEHHAQVAAVA
jgi:hypothetical protein